MSSYNIRSISELPATTDYEKQTSITANFRQIDDLISPKYPGFQSNNGVQLTSLLDLDYDMLSCPFGSYIEMSISAPAAGGGTERTSYKFDFGAFLDKLNKTLAGIAKLNLGGITKQEADTYYVPMSGTTSANPISGSLYISASAAQTGLSVKGNSYFTNSDGEGVFHILNDKLSSSKSIYSKYVYVSELLSAKTLSATNLSAANLTSLRLSAADLTAVKLSATNLTAANLTATTKLSATNLTAANMSATTKLTATRIDASEISGSAISASTLVATDLCAGGTPSNGYGLSASSSGGTYKVKSTGLSTSLLAVPDFIADNISANDNLYVGKHGSDWYVHAAAGSITGLSATLLQTPTFRAETIEASNNLRGGSIGGEWQFNAGTDRVVIRDGKFSDSLTATGFVSELTAKAACWS